MSERVEAINALVQQLVNLEIPGLTEEQALWMLANANPLFNKIADALETFSERQTPRPMGSAPKDRRILVWTPLVGGTWTGAHWDTDAASRVPQPYWKLDVRSYVVAMREYPPLVWTELPPDFAAKGR